MPINSWFHTNLILWKYKYCIHQRTFRVRDTTFILLYNWKIIWLRVKSNIIWESLRNAKIVILKQLSSAGLLRYAIFSEFYLMKVVIIYSIQDVYHIDWKSVEVLTMIRNKIIQNTQTLLLHNVTLNITILWLKKYLNTYHNIELILYLYGNAFYN